MGLDKYQCKGYHVTEKNNAEIICSENNFIDSRDDDDWLGEGVYFFADFISETKYYAKAKRIKNPVIIVADINTDRALNLIDPENYNQFLEIHAKIKERYKKRKDGKKRKLLNKVVLELMYKLEKYEVVVCIFEAPYRKNKVDRTNIMPHHIQVCVREHACISSIKEI